MFGRLLRVTGSVLVIAVAFVTPVLATSTLASADTVVNGCTIVANPTATNFTNCPGADLSGANLSGVDLSFADLAGAHFVDCSLPTPSDPTCAPADLSDANLSDANFSSASLANCIAAPMFYETCDAVDFSGANLSDADFSSAQFADCSDVDGGLQETCDPANLSGANLTDVNLSNASLFSVILDPDVDPNSTGVDLSGDVLSGADLSGANMTEVDLTGATVTGANATGTNLDGSTLVNANFSGANLTNATFVCFNNTFFCGTANLTETILTGATLTGANFTGAILTGTNFTGTQLVPSNQSVFADYGPGTEVPVTWATPAALAGATPGSCTPPSGSFFQVGTATTVTCQVLDTNGNVAAGAFRVSVFEAAPPTTSVVLPSNDATVSGDSWLDAAASSQVGIASVSYELSGGPDNHTVISGSTPLLYGWVGAWNATSVPNGTYTVQSVATDKDGVSTTSAPVTITVDNPPPSTSMLIPSTGATQSGTAALLDATSTADVTSVSYELSGGTLTDQVIATATATIYGWVAYWNTTSVPNGTYTVQSVGTYSGGTVTSAPITITVSN